MKANKKTLLAFKSMLENEQEYYDFEGMLANIVAETKLLHDKKLNIDLAIDECVINWGDDEICNLSDFIDSFSRIFLEKICNMAESMIGEDISCYSEDYED